MADLELSTSVNGRHLTTTVPTHLTLAEFLREKQGLRGTKVSCETQVCGACTVLLDRRPVSSCTTLAADAEGRQVATIEGLATDGSLDAIQGAFVACTALQCGYCTPGFVMATKALLDRNPHPTRDEIEHALDGNLCRCTGYLPIIDAVEQAAARRAGTVSVRAATRSHHTDEQGVPYRYVGQSLERVDARAKVTGAAVYAVDVALPDTLHAAVVRSDRAHARIRAIDSRPALAETGCVAVITGGDLEGLYPRFGHLVPDHYILATDKVRYYGEPVALVVASDRHTAHRAARLVEVDYDDLPAVMDVGSALGAEAASIHERHYDDGGPGETSGSRTSNQPNVATSVELAWGDVDAVFETATAVVETTTSHPALYAFAMEPYSASARFNDGHLEVVSCAQHPFMVVKDLARIFGLPQSHVRVSVPYVGGGYGSKSYTKIEPLAAVAAWKTGRAVKLELSIEESIYTTRSDAADTTVRSAFDAEGSLLARDITVLMDTGAYVDNSATVLAKAVNRSFGPYRLAALRVRGRLVYTTTVPASSYRALGAFQVNLAGETNMDRAAEQLGVDPAELRRRNLVRRGEELVPGLRPMDADLAEDLDELVERLRVEPRPGLLQGMGFGCGANDAGAYPTSSAQVRMSADGSVLVLTGSTELGQGSRSVLSQIAAEELGVDLSVVRVLQGDSASTPFERTTGASRTTTMTGLSVQRAARDVVDQLRVMAADLWGAQASEVTSGRGVMQHRDGTALSFAEVVTRWYGGGGGEVCGRGTVRRTEEFAAMPAFWEIGMVGVTVDIDPETGVTRVDQLVTVADVGFAINPRGVEGQDLGAAVQGFGGALSEQLVYEGEQLRNPNLVEYRVPHIGDAPRRFESILVEKRDGIGPYGAKGVGEGARIPVGGAVAAAVARAVGVWPTALPLTPEHVWNLIRQGRPGSRGPAG